MITTKSCSTCEHFPNDHHCVGCVWDQGKGENTKWELKINPIVIERAVLDKIRAEFQKELDICDDSECDMVWAVAMEFALEVIDKYREGSDKE